MSKWVCKTEKCEKPCYAEPPDHCRPTRCLLKSIVKPEWQEVTEPTTTSSQLQKWTAEVFDREDCPAWAKYAAMDEDGMVVLFDHRPTIAPIGSWWDRKDKYCPLGGRYDCSDWRTSLIERPEKKTVPKLTAEVFNRPDCPEWAKYASVNKDGFVIFYEEGTSLGARKESIGIFDNSDWQNSLIERPEKKETLPDWCKVGEWGYNPSRGLYFEIVEISDNHIEVKYPHITNECYRLTIEYFKECNPSQAHLRPFNAEEMQGLVGKIIESDKYVHFINTFDKVFTKVVTGGDKYTANELLAYGYTINGKRCGVLEHLENGEWVE